jgi:kumamolisin
MRKHASLQGSERIPLPGAHVIGQTNARIKLEVTLKVRRKRKLPELGTRPAAIMTRKALAAKYGASKKDIAKVSKAFGKYGLKKICANSATRTVRLRGTVAQLEAAFHTKLFDYAHKDGDYRGRVGALHTPPEVKNIVQGVFGLDDRRVAQRRRQPARAKARLTKTAFLNVWYTPGQLAAHYNFPAGDGQGQTVGLLEFGGGYFSGDLKKFCKLVGSGVPKVRAISVDGTSTLRRDGNQGEVMLDVEVIAGVCPKATIAVYFAQWTERGWITALDAAVHDKKHDPSVVSVSWGNAEDTDIWTEQAVVQINETLKEAAYLGITVCVAAGDDGSSDAVNDGLAHVDFPGSSPYVLSVGGTTIPMRGNPKVSDIVWKKGDGLRAHNGGSTGGGVSALFPRPKWQCNVRIKSVNPGSIVGRCIPDVAANADWATSPYLLVVNGKPQPNGGTSAACPLWAALIARINGKRAITKRIGYLTPALYQRAKRAKSTVGALGCIDVLSGDNTTNKIGGYSAGPGYDAASGWGTPNGERLLSALPF